MRSETTVSYAEYEKLVADAIRDVVSEIRLIELNDLVSYVGSQRMNILEALFDSATELYFRPGTLKFTRSAVSSSSWGGGIALSLGLLFQHEDLRVYFTLCLRHFMGEVQIDYISFGDWLGGDSVEWRTSRIVAALAAARRRPADNRLAWWSVRAPAYCSDSGTA